jgi:glycosyltransferase involved in cell wall biosynthesis
MNFETFGINIEYKPHFIPDPNPSGEILPKSQRPYDFITVGINEMDFDRKGHWWNFMTEVWGFKSIRVCKNFCFGKYVNDIPDEELYKFYKNTKYYLAMSHAETPHLPLLEAFAFGTPTVFLYAHEFMFLGVGQGIPVDYTYVNLKGYKNFWFYEVNAESFIDAIGEAYRLPEDEYMNFAKNARNLFEKEFKMENRIKEFKDMMGL